MSDLRERLRRATDAVMEHQWSHNIEAMCALTNLIQVAHLVSQQPGDAALAEPPSEVEQLRDELKRLRADAERYHYIRDNHETRGQAMEIVYGMNGCDWDAAIDAALAAAPTKEPRPCTCHPDDKPPSPCVKKYAFAECLAAAPAKEPT